MTVVKHNVGDNEDPFPVGMRVLAVDDNPPCLMLLATLLRRCQYKVTTTNQAVTALRMLRERKEDFDLVISDVDMPDMDGFKLLQHVGLEMDLPVIMLSSHSDPKLVMRGITNGACDYLLKPVRIEELQNIWQHVIRKKTDGKDQKSLDKGPHENEDGLPESKLNKKRKDQKDDEEDDCDNDRCETDDSLTQKKPRVVWSVELHGKFVAAVNQLGLDKAVPKKILDLMNVDKLTRENVASHLQKYRLYLKRIKSVANQQALVDPSFIHSSSINGFGSHFQGGTFRTFPNRGMLRRLNSTSGFAVRDLPSTGLSQYSYLEAPEYHSYFQNNILQGLPVADAGIHQAADKRDDSSMLYASSSGGYQGEKAVTIDAEPATLKHGFPLGENSWCGAARDDVIAIDLPKENVNVPRNMQFQFDGGVDSLCHGNNQMLVGVNSVRDVSAVSYSDSRYGASDGPARPKDGYLVGQQCLQNTYSSNCFGSLEDLVGAVVKQEQGWGI